ncbi:hypothetical protein SNEBB_003792 [Seison nebaliae]|nr:hypothetical protein SNEBB_003792 [Seison nebaliae]
MKIIATILTIAFLILSETEQISAETIKCYECTTVAKDDVAGFATVGDAYDEMAACKATLTDITPTDCTGDKKCYIFSKLEDIVRTCLAADPAADKLDGWTQVKSCETALCNSSAYMRASALLIFFGIGLLKFLN